MDLFQPIEKIRFGDYVMTEAKQLVSLCTENHLTISSCESLTAGLFTSTIASIPGASAILKGGLVTYFTPMKSVLAHVDVNLIQKYGVISEECAYAMAKNTREIMDVDYCVSFTGNAGPSAWEENQQEESIVLLLLKKRFVYMVFNVRVYLEMM